MPRIIDCRCFTRFSFGCSRQTTEPTRTPAANQALYGYLGQPVSTPPNLEGAYTKDGLAGAMRTAAQAADISLARLEIDDSEFPFLIGVVCAHHDDLEALKDEISNDFGGGIGGNTQFVMYLVPSSAFLRKTGSGSIVG